MRNFGVLVVLGLSTVMASCSSSNSQAGTGGGTGNGGATTTTGGQGHGGVTGTGGTSAGACNMPSCLANLAPSCAESGSCQFQTDLSTDISLTCYDNGIKERLVPNASTGVSTLTVMNGTSTCFSTTFDAIQVYQGSAITVMNASGAAVASVQIDSSGLFGQATCTGGQPVTLDPSCSTTFPVSVLVGSQCDEGVCSP